MGKSGTVSVPVALSKKPRAIVAVAVIAAAAMSAQPAAAEPARVEIVRSVSPPNPFEACGGDRTVYKGNEYEPSLAVNPRDPSNLIVAWQQDQLASGGSVDVAGAYSKDGGKRWTQVTFPGTTRCTGAAGSDRNADVWLSFGADGQAYFASLPGRPGETPGAPTFVFDINTRLLVHRSTDGGRTWKRPVEVPPGYRAPGQSGAYLDKDVVAADPRRPGRAYLVWFQRDDASPFRNWLSRTTDDGSTWSTPAPVQQSEPGTVSYPAGLLPMGDGTLVYVYASGPILTDAPHSNIRIMARRSPDDGLTWSEPALLSPDRPGARPRDPDTKAYKNGDGTGSAAIGGKGAIYVVWEEISSTESSRIAFSRSTDQGRTWSAPGTVANCKCQAFMPSVAVMPDGTVGVVYHDDRHDKQGDRAWTVDTWLAHSQDRGKTWTETRLSGSFDYRTPDATEGGERAASTHEYESMVALPDGFAAAFYEGRGQAAQGPSDIFFARVTIGERRPRIRLAVRPRRARPGRRTRFRFRATYVRHGKRRAVRRARVRFAGKRRRTNARGRAVFRVRLRPGHVYRAVACKRGFRCGRTRVRVSARRPR